MPPQQVKSLLNAVYMILRFSVHERSYFSKKMNGKLASSTPLVKPVCCAPPVRAIPAFGGAGIAVNDPLTTTRRRFRPDFERL